MATTVESSNSELKVLPTALVPAKVSSLHEDKKEDVLDEKHFQESTTDDAVDDWTHDPINPRNWSSRRKWTAVGIVSLYTFVSPLASSMMAPGLPKVAEKYHIKDEATIAMTLTIFLLSYAIGPLVFAPLSEMYGRTWLLHIGNLLSVAFNIGCAYAPTTSALIGLRFLAGLSGSAPVAIGSGTVSDLFAEKDRASAMALYTLGPLIGPVIGPIAGGFIAQTVGIKWVFIVIACATAFASVVGLPFLRETYAPVIRLRRDMARDPEKASRLHAAILEKQGSKLGYIWLNLSRPILLLSRSFICFILSLYMAFLYGCYYLMFATFPTFFSKTYGFSPGIGGLAYIGLGVGFILATIFSTKFADGFYHKLVTRNGGVGKPEMRIPALIVASFFVPVGLLWYGWSAQAKLHWIMPIIGTGIFGFGLMSSYLPIFLYLIDAFTYAASATAAASVFRSLLGFVFPLFGQQMFDKLTIGGGNSLLAGLAIVLGIPFPIWIYYRGEEMRKKNKYTR